MVVRVAKRVHSGVDADTRVVVAGDDVRILEACRAHGVDAILTRKDHASGSDRLAEACELLALADDVVVVNVQGDEPLIDPGLVRAVASQFETRPGIHMATAAHPLESVPDFVNPNVVKVVIDQQGRAMYFSRAPIPWWRDGNAAAIAQLPSPVPLRHIGIYAYRTDFVRRFPSLETPAVERCEALEQLRVLWHGFTIQVHVTDRAPGQGVDTPDDLERVRALFA